MMTEHSALKPQEDIVELTEDEMEDQLPRPVGYHVLVAMPEAEQTFGDGTILKATTTVHHDSIMSMIGLVLDMGDQAYSDESRFSTGPWCKVGDYVMFRMNTGTRFKVGGKEFRLFNDDSVEAVVNDPRGVTRV